MLGYLAGQDILQAQGLVRTGLAERKQKQKAYNYNIFGIKNRQNSVH